MVKRICRNRLAASMALAALAFLGVSKSYGEVSVHVDRDTVSIQDSFRVVMQTDQPVSENPDFSPLYDDFEVLGTSRSTNINLVNGRMQRSTSWTLDLMARREGVLTIPAVVIGNEFTQPVDITVKAGSVNPGGTASADVMLEVEVDGHTPYVQGQVIYTVRLLRQVQISNASLTEPKATGGDVVIERIGDDVSYETTRNGKRFSVIERRYALFPQSSGKFTIEPLLFEGRVGDSSPFSFDLLARGRVVRVRSDPVELEARTIPADFTGNTWLPASKLELTESATNGDSKLRAGEPFTRTLTLQATGLSSSQLPEIGAVAPPGIKQYPDQPVLENRFGDDGLIAVRKEKIALIPSAPGTYTLPAIEIPWWNTKTDRMEVASLPERTIEVLPAPGSQGVVHPSPPVKATEQPPTTVATEPPAREMQGRPGFWFWSSLVLGVGWLATGLGWLWSRRKPAVPKPVRREKTTEKQRIAAIRSACSGNDAVAAKTALLGWAVMHWPGSRINSLGDFAARLDGNFQQRVNDLGRVLYRDSGREWQDGERLWRAFDEWRSGRPRGGKSVGPELEPLYLSDSRPED